MTKPFKLRIHLPSFQLCRSISSAVMAKNQLITVNPKEHDGRYPSSPPPPPSSPNRNVPSKIMPIGMDFGGSRTQATYSDNMDSISFEKLYNSPEVSAEFEAATMRGVASSNAGKSHRDKSSWLKDQSATSFSMSVSPAYSSCFSSEDEDDDNDDDDDDDDGSEGQLSSCSSFNSTCEFGNGNRHEKREREGKVRRDKIKLATAAMLPESSDSSGKKTVLGRLLPCVVDGKVNESYAIMKKSADPFDDFKMSMLEMIQDKQISEPEDLEKLLMCFLSLNAKDHHAVIVAAFTEVWEELYSSADSQHLKSLG